MVNELEKTLHSLAHIGKSIAKLLGIAITLYGLHQLWFGNEKAKYPFILKAVLSLLYTLHIGAISLATAALFSCVLVTIPFASTLISVTTLIKNSLDVFKQKIYQTQLNHRLNQSHLELKNHNINVRQNKGLYNDMRDCINDIILLEKQHEELLQYLVKLDCSDKQEIFNLEKSRDLGIFSAQLIHTLSKKENLSLAKAVKQIQKKIEACESNRNKYLQIYLGKPHSKQQSLSHITQKIQSLNKEMIELVFLYQYFARVAKSREEVKSLEKRLLCLSQIYNKPPFNIYDNNKRNELFNLEKQYLNKRIKSLKNFITKGLSLKKSNSIYQHAKKRVSLLKANLHDDFKKQLNNVKIKLKALNRLFVSKEKYLIFFTKDARKEAPKDISYFLNIFKNIIVIEKELQSVHHEQSKFKKSTIFSLMAACLSLSLYMTTMWVFSPLILTISILSGLSTLADFYQKYIVSNHLPIEPIKKKCQLVERSKESIAKIDVPLTELIQQEKLNTIMNDLENNHRERQKIRFPRQAKAKGMLLCHQQITQNQRKRPAQETCTTNSIISPKI